MFVGGGIDMFGLRTIWDQHTFVECIYERRYGRKGNE
jgi:hypothetical protein